MKKEELLYCIFSVDDYKGGELSEHTNLSFPRFINTLTEIYEDKLDKSLIENLPELQKYIEKSPPEYDEYAGGDGTVAHHYCIKDGKLVSVSPEEYSIDIANYIHTNWK